MLTFLLITVGVISLVIIIFVLSHLDPLSESEVKDLARKRRNSQMRLFFRWYQNELVPDMTFKKSMLSTGKFYEMEEDLIRFPSSVAALLKYKKHEWIIFGFEREKKVLLMWVNKGADGQSVSSYLPRESILAKAKNHGVTTVLRFHNHPNSNPNLYRCDMPSKSDLETAASLAAFLNEEDINFIDFVCERGRHHEFYLSPANSLFPLREIEESIWRENGTSLGTNLSLHWERIFTPSIDYPMSKV